MSWVEVAMKGKALGLDDVRRLVMSLPGVEEGTLHGAPSWKLKGKLLACPAIHKSAEPDSLLVKIAPAEREVLLAAEPGTYYVTDHYRSGSVVLVRLTKCNRTALRALLKSAWQFLHGESSSRKPKARRKKVKNTGKARDGK